MSEKWEGFTEEEILNISMRKYPIPKDSSQSNSPVKKTTFKFGKKNMTRERMLKTSNKHLRPGEKKGSLPQGARLFIPQIPEEDEAEEVTQNETNVVEISSSPPVPSELSNDTNCTDEFINHPPVLLSITKEKSLDEFEKRQKIIKEQNRQKKELLKRALEDRTKKTHEEARRLGQIEEELKKLDVKLSNDVSILRKQIEIASLEFMETQKRFDRAEKEYLEAKLALFTKREHKELLTGHLCTIIEENELRKARKLSDLMDKLNIGSVIVEKSMVNPSSLGDEEPPSDNNKQLQNQTTIELKDPT